MFINPSTEFLIKANVSLQIASTMLMKVFEIKSRINHIPNKYTQESKPYYKSNVFKYFHHDHIKAFTIEGYSKEDLGSFP